MSNKIQNGTKVESLKTFPELKCVACSKDLSADRDSVFVLVKNPKDGSIVDAYFACKGGCDAALEAGCVSKGYITEWYDLSDMSNPILWIKNVLEFLSRLQNERNISSEAFKKIVNFIVATYPSVCRELSEAEVERFKDLDEFGLF